MPTLSKVSTFGARVDEVICLLPTWPDAFSSAPWIFSLLVSPPVIPSNVHYGCLGFSGLKVEM